MNAKLWVLKQCLIEFVVILLCLLAWWLGLSLMAIEYWYMLPVQWNDVSQKVTLQTIFQIAKHTDGIRNNEFDYTHGADYSWWYEIRYYSQEKGCSDDDEAVRMQSTQHMHLRNNIWRYDSIQDRMFLSK